MQEELEYRGETQPRRRNIAIILTLMTPGVGYMYIGQLLKGVIVNLLFLLMLETFVIIYSVLKFFPLLPIATLTIGWIVFSFFAAADVSKSVSPGMPETDDYLLKGYNHWMMYALVALLTFVAPIAVTLNFVTGNLLDIQTVNDAGMFPTIRPGDTVLIDQAAYRNRPPARGELVLLNPPDGDPSIILRVVAAANDVVRIEGEQVFVNEQPLGRARLPKVQHQNGNLLAMVESNNGSQYVISVAPKAYVTTSMPASKLRADEVFVLADNRSLATPGKPLRDSRLFEAVSTRDIIGKPLYIAWSESKSGSIRTERIGLRIR